MDKQVTYNYRSIFWLILLLFLIHSCVEEVDSKYLPSTTPKIVLHSFVSPSDSTINVRLTKSIPVFSSNASQQIMAIPNAIVKIFNIKNPTEKYLLNYYPDSGVYQIPTKLSPILYGETYKIEVETFEGVKVEATTDVPKKDINIIQFISYETSFTEFSKKYKVKFKLNDINGEENYYRVIPIVYYYNKEIFMNENYTYDTLITSYPYIPKFLVGNEYISDNNKDGESFNYEIEFDEYSSYPGNTSESKLFIQLQNINKDYYFYCSSINNEGAMEFFSEPVTQYTNVKGGIGVFGGYNTKVIEINLGN